MKKRCKSPQGWTIRTITAHQEFALLLTGAAFLGSFVMIGMHAPTIYEAARAQMEEIEQTYDDTKNQEQYIKGLRETHKNWERELKNISRTLKGMDLSHVQDLLLQFQNAIDNQATTIGSEDFWNQTQDVNDIQRELGDEFQHLYAVQNYWQFSEQIKNAEREAKGMDQQLKEVKRQMKDGEFIELQTHLDGYKKALDEIKDQYRATDVNSVDLQSTIQDIQYVFQGLGSDYSQPFYEKIGEQREQANRVIEQKEAKKFTKQTKRTIKDFERKVKRFQRKKLDIAELLTIIDQLKSLAAEIEGIANSLDFNGGAFWDLRSEFSELQSEGFETITVIDMQLNLGRWLKGVARELKNNERMVSDFKEQAKHGGIDASAITELQELLASMKEAVAEANEAFRAQKYEEAIDAQQRYFDDNQDFHETASSLYEAQSVPAGEEISRENIEQIASMLSQALQKLESAVNAGAISPEGAGMCRSIFEEAQKIVSEILATFDRGGDAAELFQRLQALGEKLDPQCQALVQ